MTPVQPLVVVGDCLLDIDLNGEVSRLCPDEPAPVVENIDEVARPGGAGLAALLASRWRPTILVTALGDDHAADRIRQLLQDHVTLIDLGAPQTVVKMRVRAAGRTLFRIDRKHAGSAQVVAPDPEVFAMAAAVLVSDYGLGITGRPEVRRLLGTAPTVWDPHPRGADPVTGVATVTPNRGEVMHFAGPGDLTTQGHTLLRLWQSQSVTMTRGSHGAAVITRAGSPYLAPAPTVVAADTCGAGDAFAAALTNALADGSGLTEAAVAGTQFAADYLQAGGVAGLYEPAARTAPADPAHLVAQVRASGGKVVMAGGCFDLLHAGHVSYLQAARQLGDCLIVALNSDDSVRALKGSGRPVVTAPDRARVLQALECVDAVVVFDEPTPAALLSALKPDIFAKGGDYQVTSIPETPVVRAYGGEVVVLPTLPGRSSSHLVRAAQAAATEEEEQCRTQPA